MNDAVRGVGIGLRNPHVDALLAGSRPLDFVEIIPENYVGRGGRDRATLRAARERWPVLVHGVSTSIGGPDPFDADYLAGLKVLLRELEAPFYTDHLCFTTFGGRQSHQLLPLPTSDEAVAHAAARIRELRDRLDIPVAVENISQYASMPGSTMGLSAFVAAVCEEADCGLLLDVNNLFVNAANFHTDPAADLAALPLSRVVQIHVAGHERRGDRLIDNHGAPVTDAVRVLLRDAVAAAGREVPVLLERDLNLPPLDEVLDEADSLRRMLAADLIRGAA